MDAPQFSQTPSELSGSSEKRSATIRTNLERIRGRIEAACTRAGRGVDEVTLVGVTKYVGRTCVDALVTAGLHDLGESRPQQFRDRKQWFSNVEAASPMSTTPQMPPMPEMSQMPTVRWHMIGNVQRNKVKYLLPEVALIHSVDNRELGEQISKLARRDAVEAPLLVEVHISEEQAKAGVAPDDAATLIEALRSFPGLRVCGLMGMAPLVPEPDAARPYFAKLAELRSRLLASGVLSADATALSMGMSGDYEAAILEGATHVRIGSALFDGLSDAERQSDA